MKCFVAVCASLLCAGLGAAQAGTPSPPPAAPPWSSLVVPAQHRCSPSHCTCNGARPTRCTRDCRRDRSCMCVRGRYICSLYIRG